MTHGAMKTFETQIIKSGKMSLRQIIKFLLCIEK